METAMTGIVTACGSREQSLDSFVKQALRRMVADTPDLLELIEWLSSPAVCDMLNELNMEGLGYDEELQWWRFERFRSHLASVPPQEFLKFFDLLIKVARYIERRVNDGWDTEEFIRILLIGVPRSESAFRRTLELEITDRKEMGTEMQIVEYLDVQTALLRRLIGT